MRNYSISLLQDTGDSDLASINEDIQNIALDNVEPDPVLNDLSSGKVVSRQGLVTTPQTSKQSTQNNVNRTTFQQCTNNQAAIEQSVKPTYSAPWMPSTNSGTGIILQLHFAQQCKLYINCTII